MEVSTAQNVSQNSSSMLVSWVLLGYIAAHATEKIFFSPHNYSPWFGCNQFLTHNLLQIHMVLKLAYYIRGYFNFRLFRSFIFPDKQLQICWLVGGASCLPAFTQKYQFPMKCQYDYITVYNVVFQYRTFFVATLVTATILTGLKWWVYFYHLLVFPFQISFFISTTT
jgi:hypothetical protein